MVCATTHRMFLNVGYDLTEKQIRCFFDSFGPVTDVYLPRQANGRNKGFGFATFGDADALQAALKLSAHTIDGFTVQVSVPQVSVQSGFRRTQRLCTGASNNRVFLQVKRAGPRPSEPDACTRSAAPLLEEKPQPIGRGSRRLYVGEVSDTIPAPKIKRHFGAWGKVADVSVCGKDASKRTKNYFVTFETASSAEKAHDQSPRCFEGWVSSCAGSSSSASVSRRVST